MSDPPAAPGGTPPPDVPHLLVDTCSALDVMRDITRADTQVHHHSAAVELLAAMRAGRLVVVVAPQVDREFHDNVATVEAEADAKLRTLRDRVRTAHEIVEVFGGAGAAPDLGHFDGHAARARAFASSWLAAGRRATEAPDASARAVSRVIHNHAPASPGKQSVKDCLVIETYLDTATQLRAEGLASPIVFVSSNKADFCESRAGLLLRRPLDAQFAAVGLTYAPNLPAAKHVLGL